MSFRGKAWMYRGYTIRPANGERFAYVCYVSPTRLFAAITLSEIQADIDRELSR